MFATLSLIVFVLVIIPLIVSLPVITIDFDGVINGSVYSFIRAGAYFLPMGTVGLILTLTLSLYVLRMIFACIKAVRIFLIS